jgi:hypothetical protein
MITDRVRALALARKIARRTGGNALDIYYRLLTKYHLWPTKEA